MWPRSAQSWIALLPAMAVPCLASLFYFIFFSESVLAQILYWASKVFLLLWPVLCVLLIFRTGLPRPDLRDPKHRRAIPLGILLGILIAAAMFGLMRTPLRDVITGSPEGIQEKAEEWGLLNIHRYWLFACFVALGNSLFEEYYWRWFVYGHLRRAIAVAPALILAGASFSAHHVVVLSQYFPMGWALAFGGAVGVGGVIWCVMYERQKTLAGAWVCHIIADLGFLWIGYEILFP